MLSLLQLLLPECATEQRVAVLIDAIGEVLTGHADHTPFPALEFMLVDNVPVLHMFFASTHVLGQVRACWQGFASEPSWGCLGAPN